MKEPVGVYRTLAFGEEVEVQLFTVEDLDEQVGPCEDREAVRGAVCGARISSELARLMPMAGEASDGDGLATVAALAAEVFGADADPQPLSLAIDGDAFGKLAAPLMDAFFLSRFPADAPAELAGEITGRS